jgi:hypothetical protein
MTPEQRAVYDNYPAWFAHLIAATEAIKALPLDGMLSAAARISLVGSHNGASGPEPADPVAMARQRTLIEKTIAFRDGIRIAGEEVT